MDQISVYLEPTKHKLTLDLTDPTVTVGQIVQGMVTHLKAAEQGFDVDHYLRDRIGDGYAPEWQLFRENENMQLLPPDARMAELQPPLEPDELFTLKVNAKVAADDVVHRSELEFKPPSHAQVPRIEVHEGPAHLALHGGAATLCTRPVGPGTVIIPDRDWRPPAAMAAGQICPDCMKKLVPDADLCHFIVKGQTHTLCGRSTAPEVTPEVMTIPDRDWRVPPATRRVAGHTFCPDCLTILEAPIDIHLTDQKEFVWKGKMRVTPEPMPAASNVRYLRPSDRIEQAHGHYWPDGAPETLPRLDDLQISAFVDTEGETFTIAYTEEQISQQVATQGCFAPYFPVSLGAPLPLPPAPGMEITPPADNTAQEVRVFRELVEKLDPDDQAVVLAERLRKIGTPFDLVLNPGGGVTVRVRPKGSSNLGNLCRMLDNYDDAGAFALALLADRIPFRVSVLHDGVYYFGDFPEDREADVEDLHRRLEIEGWGAPAIEPRDKR